MANFLRRMWGGAHVATERTVRGLWIDAVLLVGLAGFAYALYQYAASANSHMVRTVEIHLSLWYLPLYTFYSLCRGMAAYVISLLFTLVYAYWAAKDPRAERVLIPVLDILQSIPVIAFMPGFVLGLIALFPSTNLGLEIASVLLIFTGQAWNMTFSLYRSLRTLPSELKEASTIFGFTRWQRITQLELPNAAIGLVWNSMMSMAGGWFFLTLSETFTLGTSDFRLKGLGSYVSWAQARHDHVAIVGGILAMILMIIILDQFLWRPLVVLSQRFRLEDSGAQEVPTSWFLDFLRRSRIACWCGERWSSVTDWRPRVDTPTQHAPTAAPSVVLPLARRQSRFSAAIGWLPVVVLGASLIYGLYFLVELMRKVPARQWGHILAASGVTTARVAIAIAIGSLWTIPVGLYIGLSPRLTRRLQSVIQIAASFPAPMLFPMVIACTEACHIHLWASSVLLMILGTQWYILFNVIAGATAIPADLRESARSYNIQGIALFRKLYLPAIFPYLITGWVTACGGAWNTSIVAEYYSDPSTTIQTFGLGALIQDSATTKHFELLAATVVTMSAIVVGFNRLLWHRLYHVAETTYSLNK